MKIRSVSATFTLPSLLLILQLSAPAQEQTGRQDKAPSVDGKPEGKAGKTIKGWGEAIDPASDCKFEHKDGKLTIIVPGSAEPHDLSAELKSSTAPRVFTPLNGDFDMQVKVEGEFEPGGQSTQAGRTGYTGAGLVVFADAENYVRLERATLQRSGDPPRPYANFEIRVDGELERIGTTGDLPPLDVSKPLWLRLSRSGDRMEGAISQDGVNWITCEPKDLTSTAWNKTKVHGGVAAISTSTREFSPAYSDFSAVKPGESPAKPKDNTPDPDKSGEAENPEPSAKETQRK